MISSDASPSAAGATTRTFTDLSLRATARRSMNEPGASPCDRGNEWVRKRTFTPLWFLQRVSALCQLFEPRTKLAHLRTLSCDHLPKQSCREENTAQEEACLDEVQDRAESLACKNSPEDCKKSGQNTEDE